MAGSSGLVGGELLRLLGADPRWSHVVSLGRRQVDLPASAVGARVEQRILDFAALAAGGDVGAPESELAGSLRGPVDDVFCTLGTSLGGGWSTSEVRRVDHDFVLALARAALTAGATRFLVVTSMGADRSAPLAYCRIKGDVEAALAALPFVCVHVLRPSFLRGRRRQPRPAERLAVALVSGLGPLVPARYRPVAATAVAGAMVALAAQHSTGRYVHDSDRLAGLAGVLT